MSRIYTPIYGSFICPGCNQESQRETKYINQAKRDGKPLFCTQSCSSNTTITRLKEKGHLFFAGKRPEPHNRGKGNPFKKYLHRIRSRKTKLGNVTLEHLESVWNLQNGKCVWSGIPLNHMKNGKRNDAFTTASLDRIDSSKPYDEGNVQFVICALNLAKGNRSDSDLLQFLETIRNQP